MIFGHHQRLLWLISVVLAVLCWIVYAQTVGFTFTNLDDNIYVAANPHLSQGLAPGGVTWAFSTSRGNIWMPMTWLSFLGDHQFQGPGPAGFHRTNVLLHLSNTLLLLLLLWRSTGSVWRSALVAALFAVHPLHVESVAWVAERKDVLCGFFFLATLHFHLKYRENSRGVFYAATLLCFVLALMAKPMAVTLPVVILILDWWLGRPETSASRRWAELLPFFTLAVAITVVTYHFAGQAENRFIDPLPWPARLGRAAVFYVHYLSKSLWPVELMVHYPLKSLVYSAGTMVMAGTGLGLVSALIWKVRHQAPWAVGGWAWFLVMLLPVVGITRGGYQLMSDRYYYLPAIGLYILAAWGLGALTGICTRCRWPLAAGVMLALGSLTVGAYRQAGVWHDSETLFRHALDISPDNHLAQMNLGVVLDDEGKSAAALPHLQKAAAQYPDYLHRFNLANCLMHLQRYREAIPLYNMVLASKADFPEALNNLGICLGSTGEPDRAEAQFRQAIALQDTYAKAHYNLGLLLEQQGQSSEAVLQFRRTLELDPDHQGAKSALQRLR